MRSFLDLERTFASQPRRLGARLAWLDVRRGREGMYRDQLPQLLKALAETTRIDSITASSAIEGIVVDPNRVRRLVGADDAPRSFRNRSEREFAGYRDAIDEISRSERLEILTVPYVLHLHRLLYGHTDVVGGQLKTEQNYIASFEHGHRQILFTPSSPKETQAFLPELFVRYQEASHDEADHPILLIGALILDFLAIHPVADGNGRISRLLTTHALLQQDYGVSRYASIEQRMFETKDRYYDALYASQRGWHKGEHDIWPWIDYLVGILEGAYDDFEARIAARRDLASHSKQDQVRIYVTEHAPRVFRIRDIRAALPGVSDPTIALVLTQMRRQGLIEPAEQGAAGPQAAWRLSSSDGRGTTPA